MSRIQRTGVWFWLWILPGVRAVAGEWTTVGVPPVELPTADSVWYRCHIRVPDRLVVPATKDLWRDSMMLGFSAVPGAFEVFLNGRSILTDDGVAEGKQERFKVPKDILEKSVFNALVTTRAAWSGVIILTLEYTKCSRTAVATLLVCLLMPRDAFSVGITEATHAAGITFSRVCTSNRARIQANSVRPRTPTPLARCP